MTMAAKTCKCRACRKDKKSLKFGRGGWWYQTESSRRDGEIYVETIEIQVTFCPDCGDDLRRK